MITIFEDFNSLNFFQESLIPGNMYMHGETLVLFLGHIGGNYPVLCLLMRQNVQRNNLFQFIEWNHAAKLNPIDINFKQYIVDNNLIDTTIKSIRKRDFASGGQGRQSFVLIRRLEKELLEDPDISLYIDAKNFNL